MYHSTGAGKLGRLAEEKKETYKEPKERIVATMVFFESLICVCQRIIAGRMAQARSVTMVLAVDVYDKPNIEVIGEHSPRPSAMILGSQLAATGRHSSRMPIKVVINVAIVNPNRLYTAMRSFGMVVAIRSMVMQMDVLTKHNAVT